MKLSTIAVLSMLVTVGTVNAQQSGSPSGFGSGTGMGPGGTVGSPTSIGGGPGSPMSGSGSQTFGGPSFQQQGFPGIPTPTAAPSPSGPTTSAGGPLSK